MQEKETTNSMDNSRLLLVPSKGRIVALDPGTRRVGISVCDETQTIATPLPYISRASWKDLLERVRSLLTNFDAVALVIGLPLESEGDDGPMTTEAREMARKFGLSLDVPVFLEDERVTSYEAKSRLWQRGFDKETARELVDSEAASIILTDFLDRLSAARK